MTKPTQGQTRTFAARSTAASFRLEGRTTLSAEGLAFMERMYLRVQGRESVGTFDEWLPEALADRRKILGTQAELDRYDRIRDASTA